MSRNDRVFPGKFSKCPDSRKNLQIPGTILALSRNSVIVLKGLAEMVSHSYIQVNKRRRQLVNYSAENYISNIYIIGLSF